MTQLIEPILSDDAFLAEVDESLRRASTSRSMDLWWLGQSGFLLRWRRNLALFDPYLSDSLTAKYANTDKPHVRMTCRVIDPARLPPIDVVTSSHNHTDHLDAETLTPILHKSRLTMLIAPLANRPTVAQRLGIPEQWVWGMDAGDRLALNGFVVHAVPAAHETIERDEQGRCKFLGYVLQCPGGPAVYHSGDTVLYEGIIERLRPFNVDVALLPINGRSPERRVAGNLTGPEAARLAKEIGAKLAIPCHYEMFEFNTAPPAEFVSACERLGQPYCVLRAGERWSSAD